MSGASGAAGAPLDPPNCVFETPPVTQARPAPTPGAIQAGFGSAYFPMPIGSPLGGYFERTIGLGGGEAADGRPPRVAVGMHPSVGVYDAPRAQAVVFDFAGERLAIVRIDVVLATDLALFDLEKAIAPDGSMRGHVIMSSTHTHAGWAGWQPTFGLLPGTDLPRPELYQRAIDTMAKAITQATSALAPAKLGVGVETSFDPMDTISHDRRQENDHILAPDGNTAGMGKDPTLWAMRVDKMDGTPMLALVDFPIHGTIGSGSNPLASTDAPGAITRALTSELGYPVLHLQGAAGDVSPSSKTGRSVCPDDVRCLDFPSIEALGARAVPLVEPLLTSITTEDSAAIEVVTRSFRSGRASVVTRPDGRVLSYAPASHDYKPDGVIFDADGKVAVPVDELNTDDGAGLCGGTTKAESLAEIPGDKGIIPYSSCLDLTSGAQAVFGVFGIQDKVALPLCESERSTAAAVRITGLTGGDWLLLTAPGEPVAPYAQYLRDRSPAGKDRTLLLGYSDDHAGYLLTAEDWLQGGYEPSINLWGPIEAEAILDGVLAAGAIAWTPAVEDPEVGSSRFVDFPWPATDPLTPLTTSDHGTLVPQGTSLWFADTTDDTIALVPDATIPRVVGLARFAFYGGDPVIDQPVVIIEHKKSDGTYEPLVGATGVAADSFAGSIVTTYTPIPLESATPTSHAYGVVWQPVPPDPFSVANPQRPYSLPLGTYRFHVTGTAMAASGMTTYDLPSNDFAVVAAPLSPMSSATRTATTLQVTAMLGNAPGYRALLDGVSDANVLLPGPWTATWTLKDGTTKSAMVTASSAGVATIPVDAGDLANVMSVDLRDPSGNGGSVVVP